jgi:hypothetical protein
MSKGIDIEIDGIKGLIGKIYEKSKNLTMEIDRQMTASIIEINNLQKKYTPVDNGVLRQGNRFSTNVPLAKQLWNDVKYAPYVEFGTGGYVFYGQGWIDADMEAVAAQFKGKGKRKVNLYPQPFFFRAFFEKKKELIENIKKILTK